MKTCPNCRHNYQDDVHLTCPLCYSEKTINHSMPAISSKIHFPTGCSSTSSCPINLYDLPLSKQKQQQLKRLLSGGTVTDDKENSDNNSVLEKLNIWKKQAENNVSPTASLSFILPPVSLFASCNTFSVLDNKFSNSFYNSEEDLRKVVMSQKYLKISGWYHQRLSWKSAIELLMPTTVGTFLVRDSSDSKYLYTLSVQTKCGPTSIRIHYSKGEFRLDADDNVANLMPKFTCLMKLIQNYIDWTKSLPLKCSFENENPTWVHCMGKIYSQIVLTKPIHSKNYFPSLKHLSRLCINRHLIDSSFRSVLPAPSYVVNYLQEYPFKY